MGIVDHHKYRKLKASTPQDHLLLSTSFLQKPLRTAMKDKSSTPRGPAINVFFNFGGGRCRGSRQHPQGAAINVFFNFGGGHCWGS
jgi:hypothetical protein